MIKYFKIKIQVKPKMNWTHFEAKTKCGINCSEVIINRKFHTEMKEQFKIFRQIWGNLGVLNLIFFPS